MKKYLYPVLVFLLIFIGGKLYISSTDNKQPQTDITSNVINNVNESSNTAGEVQQTDDDESVISYKIVYVVPDKRYDGGPGYYVLIDPIDLTDNDLREKMRRIIIDMTNKYGKKISIEIHDDINSLNLSYKLYGDLSLGRNTTEAENKFMSSHHIVGFSGELETGLFKNTIYYFPDALSGTEEAELAGIEEFLF